MVNIFDDLVVRIKSVVDRKSLKNVQDMGKAVDAIGDNAVQASKRMDTLQRSTKRVNTELKSLQRGAGYLNRFDNERIRSLRRFKTESEKLRQNNINSRFRGDLNSLVRGSNTSGLNALASRLSARNTTLIGRRETLGAARDRTLRNLRNLQSELGAENNPAQRARISREISQAKIRSERLGSILDRLALKVSGTVGRFDKTVSAIDKVNDALDREKKQVDRRTARRATGGGLGVGGVRGFLGQTAIAFGVSSGSAAAATLGFSGVAGALVPGALGVGLGLGAVGTVNQAKELDQYKALLSGVADENENVSKTFDLVAESAAKTGSSIQGNIELFNRFRLGQQGLSSEDNPFLKVFGGDTRSATLDAVELITKATAGISGPSVDAALVQLSQAFSNDFQASAQELNSIFEQTPGLGAQILQGLNRLSGNTEGTPEQFRKQIDSLQTSGDFDGFTRGLLKQFGRDGNLSAELILKALQSQEGVINKRFDKLSDSIAFRESVLGTLSTVNIAKPFIEGAEVVQRYNKFLERLIVFTQNNTETFRRLGETVGSVIDALVPFFSGTFDIVRNFFTGFFSQIDLARFKGLFDTLGELGKVLKPVLMEISNVAGILAGAFTNAIIGLINLINKIPGIDSANEKLNRSDSRLDASRDTINQARSGTLGNFFQREAAFQNAGARNTKSIIDLSKFAFEELSRNNPELLSSLSGFFSNEDELNKFVDNLNARKRQSLLIPGNINYDEKFATETLVLGRNMEVLAQAIAENNTEQIATAIELLLRYRASGDNPLLTDITK